MPVTDRQSPPRLRSLLTTIAQRSWTRRVGVFMLIAAVFLGLRAYQHRDIASGPAPALAGELLDGTRYALVPAPGQAVLVHFWATWCPICRAEQGSIDAIAKDHPAVTVALHSGGPDEVARFLSNENLSFPVLNDPEGDIARAWGVRGVPTSFIVDADGNIRFVEVGYTTGPGLRLRLWFARLWPGAT